MKTIALCRGADTPSLLEKPIPKPKPGEALVRTLRVGVDGTDHEVINGAHGGFPETDDHLVLGHEAVGVIEDPNDTDLQAGQVVVPTVRRPPNGDVNGYFSRGEGDMAPPDATFERGISGMHGFMAEYFTSPATDLVPIPASLTEWGFLVEPISITEKAFELANASRSSFQWQPAAAAVLGNGSLGLLTLAMLDEYERTYCLGRRDRPDPTIDIIERLGATYIDSRETPVPEIPVAHEPLDFIVEATGYPKHAFGSIEALAPNGVAALLGVPDSLTFEVDGGTLHRELVMNNNALVGSVNSGRRHFEAAVDRLAAFDEWFLDDLVTGVYAVDAFERAFVNDETTIKTTVQFHSL